MATLRLTPWIKRLREMCDFDKEISGYNRPSWHRTTRPSVYRPLDCNQEPIETFHQFTKLPLEIQWEICRHAVTTDTVINIRLEQEPADPTHDEPGLSTLQCLPSYMSGSSPVSPFDVHDLGTRQWWRNTTPGYITIGNFTPNPECLSTLLCLYRRYIKGHRSTRAQAQERSCLAIAYTCWTLYRRAMKHFFETNTFTLADDIHGWRNTSHSPASSRMYDSILSQRRQIRNRTSWLPMQRIISLWLHAEAASNLIRDPDALVPNLEHLTVVYSRVQMETRYRSASDSRVVIEPKVKWMLNLVSRRKRRERRWPKLRRLSCCWLGWSDLDAEGRNRLPTTERVRERLLPIDRMENLASEVIFEFAEEVNEALKRVDAGDEHSRGGMFVICLQVVFLRGLRTISV